MTFKEFVRWCNQRACDGRWGFNTALYCAYVINYVKSFPFCEREKEWRIIEPYVMATYVNPTNNKILSADKGN